MRNTAKIDPSLNGICCKQTVALSFESSLFAKFSISGIWSLFKWKIGFIAPLSSTPYRIQYLFKFPASKYFLTVGTNRSLANLVGLPFISSTDLNSNNFSFSLNLWLYPKL